MSRWQYKFASDADKEYIKTISDTDRYITDRYDLIVSLKENKDGHALGLQVMNSQLGLCGYVSYWNYGPDEYQVAKTTFSEVKKVCDEIGEQATFERIPMAVIGAMIRHGVEKIDIPHFERSGVIGFNWYNTDVDKAPDWRTTIYGNRYPSSSLSNLQENWNLDESGRQIEQQGQGRNTAFKFKYAQSTQNDITTWLRSRWQNLKLPIAGSLFFAAIVALGHLDWKKFQEIEQTAMTKQTASQPMQTTSPPMQTTLQSGNSNFSRALEIVLENEGGYVNDPRDRGGATNKGITQKTYQDWLNKNKLQGDIQHIPDDHLQSIYREYWDAIHGDQLPELIAIQMFDFAVNSGPKRAIKALQSAIGTKIDGVIGPQTQKALQAAIQKIGEQNIASGIVDQRSQYIHHLLKNRHLNPAFGKGLKNRIGKMRKFLSNYQENLLHKLSNEHNFNWSKVATCLKQSGYNRKEIKALNQKFLATQTHSVR